jgi:hypothetical protein
MHALRSIIAVAALAVYGPAYAAIGDPEVIIYRVSGVADSGGATGVATTFHCTNFSGVTENVRIVVRATAGNILANLDQQVPHLWTVSASTKDTIIYTENIQLATGGIPQGTAAIAATSVNVTCTAMQVESNNTSPVGIKLHMTRFNPISGTQE